MKFTATLVLAAVAASSANAAIINSSPTTNVAPGNNILTDVTKGAVQSNAHVKVFRERTDYLLGSDLAVNSTGSSNGAVNGLDFISAGSTINSYFMHFDPTEATTISGGFQLESGERIIGVIYKDKEMNFADADIGRGAITYATGFALRGLENANDFFTVSANQRVFQYTFDTQSSSALEQVRVITTFEPIPTPGAAALAGVAGLAAARRRR